MWILLLNDMRDPKIEILKIIGRADTKEKLEAFIGAEKVEPYTDPVLSHESKTTRKWHKVFRRGGPLEWYNPPFSSRDNEHFLHAGTGDDWAEEARADYHNKIMTIPEVSTLT